MAHQSDEEKGDQFLVRFEEGDKENPMVRSRSGTAAHRLEKLRYGSFGVFFSTFRTGLPGTNGI